MTSSWRVMTWNLHGAAGPASASRTTFLNAYAADPASVKSLFTATSATTAASAAEPVAGGDALSAAGSQCCRRLARARLFSSPAAGH